VFLTNMENFAAVNKVYGEFFTKDPKPVRTVCFSSFRVLCLLLWVVEECNGMGLL